MPISMPWSSANATSGRQVLRKRGQLSSTLRVQSRPTKVLTFSRPSSAAAWMTLLSWCSATSADRRDRDRAGSGSSPGRTRPTPCRAHRSLHRLGVRAGEVRDVDVRDAGVFALGLADGPAHDLDAGEPLRAAKASTWSRVSSGRMAVTNPSFMTSLTDQPSTHARDVLLFMIASHTATSWWPSSAVAKSGDPPWPAMARVDGAEVHLEGVGEAFDVARAGNP